MSRIRANKITNKAGTGAVELEKGAHLPTGIGITGAGGLNITGVVTATSFSGNGAALTGIDATSIKDSGGKFNKGKGWEIHRLEKSRGTTPKPFRQKTCANP